MAIESLLSIDKISITAHDSNADRVVDACARLVRISNSDPQNPCRIGPGRWRHIQCSIPVPISIPYSPTRVHVEIGAKYPDESEYRFELNPSQLGADGLDDFAASFEAITGLKFYETIRNGIVTRIDHALDLPGLSLDELIVRSKGTKKIGIYTDRKGNPETTYIGTPRSNRVVVYNKQLDNGRGSLRIERRMKPRCPVHQLGKLINPFRKVQLISTETFRPYLDPATAELFFDSVRLGGLSRAVMKLPPGPRRAIKAMLRDPSVSVVPDTDQIWMGFPQLLNDMGFGPLLIPTIGPAPSLVPDPEELFTDHDHK